jgi:hypothetical protein
MAEYEFKRISLGREWVFIEADSLEEARELAEREMPIDHEDYEWSNLACVAVDGHSGPDTDPELYGHVPWEAFS